MIKKLFNRILILLQSKWLGLSILSFLIILAYVPVLFNFTNYLTPDSFEYYLVVDSWVNESPELRELMHFDLPLGYPYFLFICESLGFNSIQIIVLQLVLFITPIYFLINLLYSKNGYLALSSSFLAGFFLFEPMFRLQCVAFLPLAIYTSLLIWTYYFLLLRPKWNNRNILILSLLITLVISIRSNGIFQVLLFLIPMYESRNKIDITKKIFTQFGISSIIFLSLSFATTGKLSHLPIERISTILFDKEYKKSIETQKTPRLEMLAGYLTPTSRVTKQFYPLIVQSYIYLNSISGDRQKMMIHKHCDSIPTSTKELALKGLFKNFEGNLENSKLDFEKLNHDNLHLQPIITKISLIPQELFRLILAKPIFLATYFIGFISIIIFLLKIFRKQEFSALHSLIFLHFLTLLLVVFANHRQVNRYIYPTEFLTIILIPFTWFGIRRKGTASRGKE